MLTAKERIIVENVIRQIRKYGIEYLEKHAAKPLEIILDEPAPHERHERLMKLEVARILAKENMK